MDATTTLVRTPLTRQRILDAALDYIDQHGLAALSMHKLGAVLGVKGMSLYNHVANKDDVYDGVLETLWARIETAAPPSEDWCDGARALAHAIRDIIRQHPNAAALIPHRPYMPIPALRLVRDHVAAATGAGIPADRAYAVLRTLTTYALGSACAELCCTCTTRQQSVEQLLRADTPADLATVAEIFCGRANPDTEFDLGLDLMLNAAIEPRTHRSRRQSRRTVRK